MNRYFFILFAILLLSENVLAQEDKEQLFQTDTISVTKRVQDLGLPVVFYTPETSFGAGGGL